MFFSLDCSKVEKVTLFAQSRMGELADTVGSLRFPTESGYGVDRHNTYEHPLSEGGMHSSSSDEKISWLSSSDDEIKGKTLAFGRGGRGLMSVSAVSTGQGKDIANERKRKTRRVWGSHGGAQVANSGESDRKSTVRRQIERSDRQRIDRPMFHRSGHVVGEDFLLLSAVDEADAYTAVGVELMHLLRFISVNTIAVRKICKKHDRLLANRMLGGYYHRKRMQLGKSTARDCQGVTQGKQRTGGMAEKQKQRGDSTEVNLPLLGRNFSGAIIDRSHSNSKDKLIGVLDTKVQDLTQSSTIQMISSSLALALSEYEVSQCRADALSRIDSIPQRRGRACTHDSVNSNEGAGIGTMTCNPFSQSSQFLSPKRMREAIVRGMRLEVGSGDLIEDGVSPSTPPDLSLTRLQFVVVSVYGLQEAARKKRNYFEEFLSRSGMTFTGHNVVGGGLDGCSRETLDFLVRYNPDSALLIDSNTMQRCLQMDRPQGSIQSIMTSSLAAVMTPISPFRYHRDFIGFDVILNALTILPRHHDFDNNFSTSFMENCTWHRSVKGDGDYTIQHSTLLLNLSSMFLYTMNYYIISPSAPSYCLLLGYRPAYSAIVIGTASVASLLSAITHAFWISKDGAANKLSGGPSYFRIPLFMSALGAFTGNILYARALKCNSMALALGGRFLVGFGSAEVLNRHLISKFVPSTRIVVETAGLVKSSMIGTFIGPFIGTLFLIPDSRSRPSSGIAEIGDSNASAPGYTMAILWAVHMFCLLFFFQVTDKQNISHNDTSGTMLNGNKNISDDDQHRKSEGHTEDFNSDTSSVSGCIGAVDPTTSESLLHMASSDITESNLNAAFSVGQMKHGLSSLREMACKQIKESTSKKRTFQKRSFKHRMGRLKRIIFHNVALPVTMSILALTKIAHEIIFSSSPIITHQYFQWNSALTGLLLIIFGALTMPINLFVSSLSSHHFDDRSIMKVRADMIISKDLSFFTWTLSYFVLN